MIANTNATAPPIFSCCSRRSKAGATSKLPIAIQVSLKRYRYTGKERDEESAFYYHGARYYAPWLGRWVACDPAEANDANQLYSYVRSNPIKFRDSDGLRATVTIDRPAGKPPHVVVHLNLVLYPTEDARRQGIDKKSIERSVAPVIKRSIEQAWHKSEISFDKTKFSFDVEVTTSVYEDVDTAYKAASARTDDHDVVALTKPMPDAEGPDAGNPEYRSTSNEWAVNPSRSTTFAHEAGHLMGLSDDYFEEKGRLNPRGEDLPDHPTAEGQWKHFGHIMGPSFHRSVAPHEIVDIIINNSIDLTSQSGFVDLRSIPNIHPDRQDPATRIDAYNKRIAELAAQRAGQNESPRVQHPRYEQEAGPDRFLKRGLHQAGAVSP
jgi:RHS repeat-associated protein